MTTQTASREHQRLLEVAREYRKQGYNVIVEPDRNQLPGFLVPFRPDMIAYGEKENVVVEVRMQDTLTDLPKLNAIAEAVQDQPMWRFELVVTNPRSRDFKVLKDASVLVHRDIRSRLQEAHQLAAQEHGEAALLLTWSAIEALLRRIAQEERIMVAQSGPFPLMKSLFSYGLLDKEQFDILQQGLQIRNTVAHGFMSTQSYATILERLFKTADQLLEQSVV